MKAITKIWVLAVAKVLLPCFCLCQFSGRLQYQITSYKEGSSDTIRDVSICQFSAKRMLSTSKQQPLQTLISFDEGVHRRVDTTRQIENSMPLSSMESKSQPTLLDSSIVDGAWSYHYRLIASSDLMGAPVYDVTEYWVSSAIRLNSYVSNGYYGPMLNGTGFALTKFRRKVSIEGRGTTITDGYLDAVQRIPYTDADLKLIMAAKN